MSKIPDPVPGVPESVAAAISAKPMSIFNSKEVFEQYYRLYYRQGRNINQEKIFFFKGTFTEAVKRANLHCDRMGYRYQYLSPLFSDLDKDEKSIVRVTKNMDSNFVGLAANE